MGPLGMGEIVVLFILALLIFGPKKLPELGKTFGKGMAEFKRASNELKTTFQREMDSIEQETKDVKTIAKDVGKDIDTSYYDDNEDDYYNDYDYGAGSSASSATSKPARASAEGPDPAAGEGSASKGAVASQPDAAAEDSSEAPAAAPVSGLPESEEASASKPA